MTTTDAAEQVPESFARASGLRPLAPKIAVSAALSTGVGFTDSLAYAGLAAYLASGFIGGGAELFGLAALTQPSVILGFALTTFALNIANSLLREHIAADWEFARRRQLLDAYRQAEYPEQTRSSGAGLMVGMEQIAKASSLSADLIAIINSVVRVAIMMAFAFATSWNVSLVAVLAGGSLVIGLRQFSKRTRVMHRTLAARTGGVGEYVGDLSGSARELHLLDRWGRASDHLTTELTFLRGLRIRARFAATLVGPLFSLGTILVGLAVAVLAARSGAVSTTEVAASGILLIRSLSAAQTAQTSYQSFHDAKPYLDRVLTMINRLGLAARPEATGVPGPGLTLRAEAISVSYGNDVVLESLDLELAGPGGIAVVGHSGGGKSTLLLALSGLVPPDAGTVRLGGVALGDIPRSRLGHDVGYLTQDSKLLRDTLRANLTRPDSDVSDDELWTVLDSVGLRQTVAGFGDGLDSVMGRAGEGLSGGELQRLGLARLLVNRPRVWLLDEPTSALDRVNTDRVMGLITSAMDEHLVVLVTHRPELLHHCSRVILVEDGAVRDDGTVADVAARQPFVAAMLDVDSDDEGPGT